MEKLESCGIILYICALNNKMCNDVYDEKN